MISDLYAIEPSPACRSLSGEGDRGLELTRNPGHYFAAVEQSAFSASNIGPGISWSPDKMLQALGAEVDRRNDRGQTPLGGAAFKGYTDIVFLLLEHGADIDADNGGGMTPLMFAAMFGRTQAVAQLQAHGASLQRRNRLGISASFMVRVSRWMVSWILRTKLPASQIS